MVKGICIYMYPEETTPLRVPDVRISHFVHSPL